MPEATAMISDAMTTCPKFSVDRNVPRSGFTPCAIQRAADEPGLDEVAEQREDHRLHRDEEQRPG